MKINYDCIRDVLLYLEEHLTFSNELEIIPVKFEQLKLKRELNYPLETIAHTIILLDEARYIDADLFYSDDHISDISISHITYDGYQFLETIRPESVWGKTKGICKKVGSFSFQTITSIATSVLNQMLTSTLTNSVL